MQKVMEMDKSYSNWVLENINMNTNIEKYLNPVTQKVMKMCKIYSNWFRENPNDWRDDVDKLIKEASNGKIRAFHLFYNSPEEALTGKFQYQVLEEKYMNTMYPKFLQAVSQLNSNSYMYIFTCNGAISNKEAI